MDRLEEGMAHVACQCVVANAKWPMEKLAIWKVAAAKNQKGQKAVPKNGRKGGKGRRNQGDRYQLSKPWVTDEIKAAHEKKVELANKLKGNKNDELFAEFKVKRDEFVKLYDAARTEYNKNKANEKKTQAENDKQTDEKSETKTESDATAANTNDGDSAATETQNENANENENAANDASVAATS